MHPLLAVVLFAVIGGLAVLVAWPGRGWLSRWRTKSVSHRTRTEDDILDTPVASAAADGTPAPTPPQTAVAGPPTAVSSDATGSLSDVAVGERALVVGFSCVCRGMERRRLLDLGLLPGTLVEPKMASPSGDPIAYRVRGAVIALRRSQARQIQVQQLPQGAPA